MDVYSHLLAERIVYLGTAIDSGVANALIAQLLHLEADNPEQEINLYINSEGGDMSAMLAVYDTMQLHQGAGRDDLRRARPSRPARCCWRRARPDVERCCRTPGSCCTSPRPRAAARSPT